MQPVSQMRFCTKAIQMSFRLHVSAIESGDTRQMSHAGRWMIKAGPTVASVSRQHCESLSRMRSLQKISGTFERDGAATLPQ
jgi:hypothetical protein